ncbi:hypothetical protein CKO20_01160 [Rhodocyclus tenuis]|nr:hypothetical protein [Rhodocyclus tenuis]
MFSLWQLIGRQKPVADCRSGRLFAVIHCVLDQNVRDHGAASFPAANWAFLDLCREHRVGMLQMPCPEVQCLGISRARPAGQSLRDALASPAGRAACRRLAGETAALMAVHVAHGHRLLAVIGGNMQSPGCAVHAEASGLGESSGVFMLELVDELLRRELAVPFMPLRDADPQLLAEDVRRIAALFSASIRGN